MLAPYSLVSIGGQRESHLRAAADGRHDTCLLG